MIPKVAIREGVRAFNASVASGGTSHLVRVATSEAGLPLTHCGREVLGTGDEGSRLSYFTGAVRENEDEPWCSPCYWKWRAEGGDDD